MSVLKYFKNIPRSPPIGRQALSVIFFFKFATRSLEKKKGLSPSPGATGACRPLGGRQGPHPDAPAFIFFIFFKNKNFKNICPF